MSQAKNVLVKIESADSLSEVRIQKERFTVGRNPAADVFLSTVAVSRNHLIVTVNDGVISVEDPGSGNGSYKDGEKLAKGKSYTVTAGDRIQIGRGSDYLSFQLEAESDTMLTNNALPQHTNTLNTKRAPEELSFEAIKTMAPRKNDEKVRVEMPEGSVSIHMEADGKTPTKSKAQNIQRGSQPSRSVSDAPKKPYFQNPLSAIISAAPTSNHQAATKAPPSEGVIARDAAPAHVRPSADARKSEPEHYKLLDAAHDQVRRLKAQAEAESMRIIKNAHLQAGELRVEAEIQSEDFIIQSRATAQEIVVQAEKDAQKTNREIQEKIFKTLQEAQTDVEKLLTTARQTAASMRKQAEVDAASVRSQAQEKVEMAIEEARDSAQAEMNELKESLLKEMGGLREIAEEEAQSIMNQAHLAERELRTKAIADVDMLMEKARHQAESDSEALLEDAKRLVSRETKAALSDLQENKMALLGEIEDLERNRANLDGFLHGHRAQMEQEMESKRHAQEDQIAARRAELERDLVEQRLILDQDLQHQRSLLEKEMQEQRANFEKNAKFDQKEHDKKLELLKIEFNAQKEQISREIKDLREKADVEYRKKLQQDEKEISDIKMRMLDEAKSRRDEEERRFLSLKQHFKREMSRHLEMLLVPKLKESLKSESLPVHFGTLSDEIQKVVNQVLENQNRPEGETANSNAGQDDRELKKILRKHKIKKAFTYSAPLMVALLFVAKPQIAVRVHEVIRKPAGQSAQEAYLQKTLERREAKARFTPVLTPNWKNSYSDNALSTTGYMDFKLSPSVENQWIRDLNKFFTDDLDLNENTIVSFIGMESSLLLKLKNNLETIDGSSPNEGIQRLKDFETESVTEMKKVLRTEAAWQKFKNFERDFFMKNSERKPAQK